MTYIIGLGLLVALWVSHSLLADRLGELEAEVRRIKGVFK